VLKNLFQKVFNFGQQEKESSVINGETSDKSPEKKREALSQCFSLLRTARTQKQDKLNAEALVTLEKIIEIMEQEGI
jgi:hypothetical protein